MRTSTRGRPSPREKVDPRQAPEGKTQGRRRFRGQSASAVSFALSLRLGELCPPGVASVTVIRDERSGLHPLHHDGRLAARRIGVGETSRAAVSLLPPALRDPLTGPFPRSKPSRTTSARRAPSSSSGSVSAVASARPLAAPHLPHSSSSPRSSDRRCQETARYHRLPLHALNQQGLQHSLRWHHGHGRRLVSRASADAIRLSEGWAGEGELSRAWLQDRAGTQDRRVPRRHRAARPRVLQRHGQQGPVLCVRKHVQRRMSQ